MPRVDSKTTATILVDEADPVTIYVGKSAPGSSTSAAVWRIQRILINGAETSIKFANGSPEYNQIWDNRASLTYTT